MLGELLKKIKMRLFSHYSNMSFGYFSSKNSGDLINLINEQPTKALESFKQLSLLGSHFINTIILMSLAFLMTFSFGVMALLLGIFLLIIFLKMNTYVQKLSRIAAKENGILTKWLIQTLHGFKYLISTNQINSLKHRVNALNKQLQETQSYVRKLQISLKNKDEEIFILKKSLTIKKSNDTGDGTKTPKTNDLLYIMQA